MKFSILVPVYNVEKYLEQCVESLLNQTYTGEYEIILVDDGSTDSSGRICDDYARKYPGKIKTVHKKNEGLVSAREWGIKNASGEYSLFVDSDDFVEPNLLVTVNDCLERNADTDTVAYNIKYYVNGRYEYRKNSFVTEETVFENENKKDIYEALIVSSAMTSLCVKAIRTELLKGDTTDYTKYYQNNMAEDWFRSIPLLTAAKKIVCINDPLYNYRTNPESISRSYRAETIPQKNMLYVYDRLKEYLPLWGLDDDEHRQKLNARFLNEAMYTFSKYYENVCPSERKAVLEFDWSMFLPQEVVNNTNNPCESKVCRNIYNWICQGKRLNIRWFFFKKKIRKLYKKVKAGVKF